MSENNYRYAYDFVCKKCTKDTRVIASRELTSTEQDEIKNRMVCQECLKKELGDTK